MINLNDWNFTGAIDKAGGTTGEAAEVSLQEAISNGWAVQNADGSLIVTVPAVGAKTKSTKYTRGEGRELINGQKAAWTIAQGGQLLLTTRMEIAPKCVGGVDGRVVQSQAHGKKKELFRLYREGDGTVNFHCDISGSDHAEHAFPLINADGKQMVQPLWVITSFRHTVSKDNGLLIEGFFGKFTEDWKIPEGSEIFTSKISKLDAKWNSDEFYFKCIGSYLGVNTDPKHGGALPDSYAQSTTFFVAKGHPVAVAPSMPSPPVVPAAGSNDAVKVKLLGLAAQITDLLKTIK